MKKSIQLLCLFTLISSVATAAPAAKYQINSAGLLDMDPPDDDPRIPGSAGLNDEVQRWLTQFDLVVVIDKGRQNLQAFRRKDPTSTDRSTLEKVMDTRVSTGAEGRVCDPQLGKEGPDGHRWYVDVKPDRHTPTGYYVPVQLDVDHYSGEFGDAHMPWGVKWRPDGLFTHQAPDGTFGRLGTPASHGCVRMDNHAPTKKSPNQEMAARDLFTMVLMTGARLDAHIIRGSGKYTDAILKLDASCPPNPRGDGEQPSCPQKRETQPGLTDYFGKVSHQIFPDDLVNRLPQKAPYDELQSVPLVLPDGTIQKDKAGNDVMVKGYKTLYIVKDSSLDNANAQFHLRYPPFPDLDCTSVVSDKNDRLAQSQGGQAPSDRDGQQQTGFSPFGGLCFFPPCPTHSQDQQPPQYQQQYQSRQNPRSGPAPQQQQQQQQQPQSFDPFSGIKGLFGGN